MKRPPRRHCVTVSGRASRRAPPEDVNMPPTHPLPFRFLAPGLVGLLAALVGCAATPEETPEAPAATAAEPTGACTAGCSRAHPDCAGWVQLAYDVTQAGAVENTRVLASCPSGRYEAIALGVVERWRYPASESGAQDIRIQIDFGRDESEADDSRSGEPQEP